MTAWQLLYQHRKGKTLDQLASETGLSRDQVHRRIMAERWRTGEVVITKRALLQHVEQGMTVRQIADKYLCSVGCVHKKIKKYGIKMRRRGNPNWCEHSEKD